MSSNTLAEDCGRLFEVGFNIGILTYIRQHEEDFSHHLGSLYVDDLRNLHFSEMVKEAFKRTTFSLSPHKRLVAKKWFMFFLQKGFLAGLNFFREYLDSLHWQNHDQKVEIVYYQCSFCRENSIYTHTKTDEEEWRSVLTQFTSHGMNVAKIDVRQHHKKGQFLHADSIMLLHYGEQWRIMCVDLSVFSVTSPANMKDTNDSAIMRRLLLNELGYMRSKSVFSNLSIDTAAGSPGFVYSKGLETYFTAFKWEDKESVKLIQAGSYAYDFYIFLKKKGILTPEDAITLNVVGYTDRGINAMSVGKENIEVLHTCANIYQRDSGKQEIQDARQKVLEMVSSNAAESFKEGTTFTSNIMALANHVEDGIYWIPPHQECEENFVCSWDNLPLEQVQPELVKRIGDQAYRGINLLDAHATLVTQALEAKQAGEDASTYLFLTGNPGIGKTTAIANFLLAHKDEGFLFFYVSPRKQVNLDIVNKFRVDGTGPLPDNVLALTSNSIIIHNNMEKPTVHYYSAQQQGTFWRPGVDAKICFQDGQEQETERQRKHPHHLEQFQEDRIRATNTRASGVLNSICNALYANMQEPISNQIIATVAIQSLKRTTGNGDTLKHLEKIFMGAFNKKKNIVNEHKMKEIASRIRHIFIMVDEITGDESGVEFLAGISKFIKRYGLTHPDYGFNTKVIIADASIVDRKVIEQHLSTTDYSPDKIYFRHVPKHEKPEPLSREEFDFRGQKAVMINANSYPARRLHLTYKVAVEFVKYEEDITLNTKDHLPEVVQQQMLEDMYGLLKRTDVLQVIIYIQDKRRLAQLIAEMRKYYGTFEKNVQYLEIHANISEAEKESIQQHKNDVRVVFMTASASRGLSFPNATHILVSIPRFEIEQNLMEIIQVIYRGRGNYDSHFRIWSGRITAIRDDSYRRQVCYCCGRNIPW